MAKILVVDDDARNLRLAVTALEQAGHEVLSAEGGAEGIEAALAHAPDLAITDRQPMSASSLRGTACATRSRTSVTSARILRARGTVRISGTWHRK